MCYKTLSMQVELPPWKKLRKHCPDVYLAIQFISISLATICGVLGDNWWCDNWWCEDDHWGQGSSITQDGLINDRQLLRFFCNVLILMSPVYRHQHYRHQHYSIHALLRSIKRRSSSKSLTKSLDNCFNIELHHPHLWQYAIGIKLFIKTHTCRLMLYKGKIQ